MTHMAMACIHDKGGKMLEHKDIVLPEVDLSDDDEPPGHYAEYWRLCFAEAWESVVLRYEENPDDVHAAWWYVDGHPAFWAFDQSPRKAALPPDHVSRLENEGALSHLSRDGAMRKGWPEIIPLKDENGTCWRYEFGKRDLLPDELGIHQAWHDTELDGSAPSYELAVISMAWKIWTHYGNDRRIVDEEEEEGGGKAQ